MTAALRTSDVDGGITVIDNVLRQQDQEQLHRFLATGSWQHGWTSRTDTTAFWHRHFAGPINAGDVRTRAQHGVVGVDEELRLTAPILHDFWSALRGRMFRDHRLQRCYANALPFGTEGATHTDSLVPGDHTAIYYPHETWDSDWGGETIFFNKDRDDILAAVYPKPNRLLVFPGFIHHVARGVSRACPVMRITLMFKTRKGTGQDGIPAPVISPPVEAP